jgi:hypothetical protein
VLCVTVSSTEQRHDPDNHKWTQQVISGETRASDWLHECSHIPCAWQEGHQSGYHCHVSKHDVILPWSTIGLAGLLEVLHRLKLVELLDSRSKTNVRVWLWMCVILLCSRDRCEGVGGVDISPVHFTVDVHETEMPEISVTVSPVNAVTEEDLTHGYNILHDVTIVIGAHKQDEDSAKVSLALNRSSL